MLQPSYLQYLRERVRRYMKSSRAQRILCDSAMTHAFSVLPSKDDHRNGLDAQHPEGYVPSAASVKVPVLVSTADQPTWVERSFAQV